MKIFEGKVALVSGGGRGIGREIALMGTSGGKRERNCANILNPALCGHACGQGEP